MKKHLIASLALFAVVFIAAISRAQTLPNVSYNALLNSTCSSATTFCSGTANPLGTGVSGLTGPALDVNTQNYAVATVTVAGTFTGLTINFEFSDQTASTNYFSVLCSRTDQNIVEGSEAVPNSTTRAWQCPVIATTRFRVRVSALGSGAVNTWITLTQTAIDPSPTVVDVINNIPGTSDPCANPNVLKSSVAISAAGVGTTQLVALSGSTVIHVCGFLAVANAGTNPSFQLEYGTGASCGTGTTALTGAMSNGITVSATAAGETLSYSGNGVALKTPAGNALCEVVAGTSAVFNGFLTYVQQ